HRPGARYRAWHRDPLHPRPRRLYGARLGTSGRREGSRTGLVSGGSASAPPLEVRGLVKRYGNLAAVAGVDLTIQSGDVYGYLGPNGAGKTTSLRMMLGLIRPTAGTVRLFGHDPWQTVRALD